MKEFITAFFSGLSDKEKKTLKIACVVVFIAIFDSVIFGPILKETVTEQERKETRINLIEKDLLILQYKDSINKKYDSFEKFFAKKDRTEEERIASLLNDVEGLAKRSTVALTNINPVTVEDSENDKILFRLTVECIGSMSDLLEFVYGINNSQKLMRVSAFSVVPKNKEEYQVKASITVVKQIVFPLAV